MTRQPFNPASRDVTGSRFMGKKKKQSPDNTIARNRVARHDYFIEDDIEVGMVLEGWEVKSLRNGSLQLKESYVMVKNGELWINRRSHQPAQ